MRVTRKRFSFGNLKGNSACVFLRKTPTKKLVFTLTDSKGKVIFCCTSGSMGGPKKFSKSAYMVEPMFQSILHYLSFFKMTYLQIFLKMSVSGHVFSFLSECSSHGMNIHSIIECFSLPHNGVRQRKAPSK